MTPENIRFHAAGHVAAAMTLVQKNHVQAAKEVCGVVRAFVNDPLVNSPPQIKEMAQRVCDNPTEIELGILERVLVDPLNTTIENSGN